jgi:hypothetical protein
MFAARYELGFKVIQLKFSREGVKKIFKSSPVLFHVRAGGDTCSNLFCYYCIPRSDKCLGCVASMRVCWGV